VSIFRTWCLLLALMVGVFAPPLRAASGGDGEVPMIALNFADTVDVRVLAKWVSEVTGQTFAYDDSFQGTVMLEAPKEIPESSLMPLFESILKLKGFALVERGDLVMIVKNTAAPALDTGVVLPQQQPLAEGTDFVNQIVEIKHADANAVASALAPFLSGPQAVRVMPDQNKLSISDYAENVRRALEIVALLDRRQMAPRVVVTGLKFARAADVVKQLDTAFQKARAAKGPGAGLPLFGADKRTNSVVIVAREEDLSGIDNIIGMLDVEAYEPERPVRIYRLQNAKAESMMPILQELLEALRQPPPGQDDAGQAASPGEKENARDIRIVGDLENNALVVAATRDDHEWFADLVDELDQRRPQVLIEAWLVVVNERGARELGVELEARGHSGGSDLRAGTFFGLTETDEDTGARGLPLVPPSGVTLAILSPSDVTAVLTALESRDNGRIISRPRLLANANEEATFKSIREEPTTTISAITSSTSTTSFGGFEAAGTELTITPTILEGDYVYLDIALTVSNFVGTAPSEEVPPPRESNEIVTGVAVPNLATIVIGGIVRTEDVVGIKKVPILGDIPLLGLLFRSKTKSTASNTLYAFIRPQIFRAADFSDLKAASAPAEKKAQEIEKAPSAVPGTGSYGAD